MRLQDRTLYVLLFKQRQAKKKKKNPKNPKKQIPSYGDHKLPYEYKITFSKICDVNCAAGHEFLYA